MIRKYRPIVKVLKEKKGIPTKIQVSGHTYTLLPNEKGWRG